MSARLRPYRYAFESSPNQNLRACAGKTLGTRSSAASGDQPELTGIFGGLPVAGWSGTLQSRFATPSPNKVGQGVVRAKTGSLSGVNTMAGELITKDGRLLVFALMADKTGETGGARQALDKIAARLVECGC